MSKRAIQVLGLGAVGGAGYYLYSAGGDPKAAQKHAEGMYQTWLEKLYAVSHLSLIIVHSGLLIQCQLLAAPYPSLISPTGHPRSQCKRQCTDNSPPTADASKVSAKIKSEVPGREKEFEKRGEAYASEAGKKVEDAVSFSFSVSPSSSSFSSNNFSFPSTDPNIQPITQLTILSASNEQVSQAQARAAEAKSKISTYGKEARAEVDKFDAKVEKKTSEAKSGISSWFGFGGK